MKEPLFCVYVCTVRAKHVKTYPENAESRIFDGPLSDQPDRTRDDAGKKLGQCARRRISANFSYPEESISFNSFDLMSNTKIGRYDKKHEHKFV